MTKAKVHKPTWLMLRIVNLVGFFTCIIGAVIVAIGVAGMAGKELLTIEMSGDAPVDRSHSPIDHALATARSLLMVGLALAVILLIRRLVESALDGDPFVAANVRRLRQLGLILCVAAPVARLIASWLTVVLAERDGFSRAFPLEIPVDSMIAGLGVFVLAQVFAQGVALREDVEGTV